MGHKEEEGMNVIRITKLSLFVLLNSISLIKVALIEYNN